MKVYEKSVSEPIKTLLHKRLTVSDALVYGGAIHFAFADATQNKRPSATQEFMETIMAGVPQTVGKSERVLLVRFGLSAPGLGEGGSRIQGGGLGWMDGGLRLRAPVRLRVPAEHPGDHIHNVDLYIVALYVCTPLGPGLEAQATEPGELHEPASAA